MNEAANRFRRSANFEAACKFQNLIFDAFRALLCTSMPEDTGLSYPASILEFQTAKLNLPRQIGKTTTLVSLAERDPQNNILFAPTRSIRDHIVRNMDIAPGVEVRTVFNPIVQFRGKTFPWTNILLDEPDHMREQDLVELLDAVMWCSPNPNNVRVFGVGTSFRR